MPLNKRYPGSNTSQEFVTFKRFTLVGGIGNDQSSAICELLLVAFTPIALL